MAVIELDLYAPADPEPVRRPALRRYRYAGLALAALLVVVLGGAAPAVSVLWRPGGTAQLTPAGDYQIAGGRLYTFDTYGSRLITTAWSPEPVRRLWSRTDHVTAREDGTGPQPGLGWFVRPSADDGVLLQVDQVATDLDARTGAVRWSSPDPVYALPHSGVGVSYDERYPPGSGYDEDTGAAGPVFFGSDGVFHTEPPAHTDVRAIDLRTGRQTWAMSFTGGVIAADAPDQPGAVLLVGLDRISVVSARTGALLRDRRVAGQRRPELADGEPIVGDLVLIQRGTPGRDATVTAYSSRTLAPVWQRPEPMSRSNPVFCDHVLCAADGSGAAVLDPRTGRPAWRVAGLTTLIGRDTGVLEVATGINKPRRLRDPATGATLVDLAGWSWYASDSAQAPLLLGRPDEGRTVLGVLRPGRVTVEALGYTDTPVTQCQAADRYVACRTDRGVQTWSYLS